MKAIIPFILFCLLATPIFAKEEKETLIEKMAGYYHIIDSFIQGSLDSRGLSYEALFQPNTASWTQIAQNISKDVGQSQCKSTDCPQYAEDFAQIVKSRLGHADELRILENEDSFEMRRKLLQNAKRSIHVLVWAVYDDETGREFRDLLLEAHERNPEMEIKLIVDGNIANLKGRKVLKTLEKKSNGKIKILRWKSKKYRANGNHRKIIVVDYEHVIVGGMNIGNMYSHMATEDKWRDLDVYIKGLNTARVAYNQFAEVWNKQIDEHKKLKSTGRMAELELLRDARPTTPVVFVDQHPGSATDHSYHNIHTAIVKLMRDAKESIDIENAYFIMDPVIKAELQEVIKRGVKVRIYTNSSKSVDEQVVSMPVIHSAREAFQMGAEIYLREGTTLHSKYMIVDNKISMVGSFNLHPRSLRFDAENVAVIFDKDYAQIMTRHFEEGLKEATPHTQLDQFKVDWSFISLITSSLYYDFL